MRRPSTIVKSVVQGPTRGSLRSTSISTSPAFGADATSVDTAVGRVPTQIDYSDYRDVSGVKVPFRWIVTWTNGQATTELSEVQLNVPIDAAKLARPAPAPRPQ